MKTIFTVVTLSVPFLLSGCASMSEEECLTADWQMIGTEDGSLGRPVTTLANHRKACAKIQITPNQAEYERGHAQGLLRYCTYNNGRTLGMSGSPFFDACPLPQATSFLAGFEQGKKIYTAKQIINALNHDAKIIKTKIATAEKILTTLEESLINGEGDENTRRDALEKIDQRQQELQSLRDDLYSIERRLQRKQRDYETLLQS